MLRKSVVILTVFAFVFGMAGLALAANRVEVKVTSEPIPQGSSCAKAGGFSLEWDEGTVIRQGDQITIDAQFGTTICRPIDIIVSADNAFDRNTTTGALTIGVAAPFTAANFATSVPSIGAAFTRNSAAAAYNVTGAGIFFWIHGEVGTQRVTIDVIGGDQAFITEPFDPANAIQIVDDADPTTNRTLELTFLGSRTNATGWAFTAGGYNDPDPVANVPWTVGSGLQGIFEASAPDSANVIDYNDAADLDDNTLCLNVSGSDFAGTVVKASMDSKNNIFNFIPSDPQIAHISTAADVVLLDCKNAVLGAIRLPEEQADCGQVDLEPDWPGQVGYWAPHENNRVVLQKTSGAFDSGDLYEVQLEIVSPATGVYWSSDAVGYTSWKTVDNCNTNIARTTGFFAQATTTYHNRAGTKLKAIDIVSTPTACTVDPKAQATRLLTTAVDVFGSSLDASGVEINIPAIIFDGSVQEGQEVEILITFSKTPCGALLSDTFSMGIFGVASDNTRLVYPYFTEMSGTDWWNGIAINNMGDVDGSAMVFVWEHDGDRANLEIEVAAHETYVNLLSNIVGDMTVTQEVNGLGNSALYIWVCANFYADGFAMIANNNVGDEAGESMGYIPRPMGDYRDFCKTNFPGWGNN